MEENKGASIANTLGAKLWLVAKIAVALFLLFQIVRFMVPLYVYEHVLDWTRTHLGLDYYLAQFSAVAVAVLASTLGPYLAWHLLFGRHKWAVGLVVIGLYGLGTLLIYTIGQDVKFSRVKGPVLKCFIDRPDGTRVWSSTCDRDPVTGRMYQPYTPEQAEKDMADAMKAKKEAEDAAAAKKADEERKRLEEERKNQQENRPAPPERNVAPSPADPKLPPQEERPSSETSSTEDNRIRESQRATVQDRMTSGEESARRSAEVAGASSSAVLPVRVYPNLSARMAVGSRLLDISVVELRFGANDSEALVTVCNRNVETIQGPVEIQYIHGTGENVVWRASVRVIPGDCLRGQLRTGNSIKGVMGELGVLVLSDGNNSKKTVYSLTRYR